MNGRNGDDEQAASGEIFPGEGPPAIATPGSGVSRWFAVTFSALSVRNYRLFMAGQGMSLVGTWMRRTALGWIVYEMTGSEALLGTVLGLALLPMFVLSPVAGSIADRVDKRRLIIWSQMLAFGSSMTVAILLAAQAIQVWQLMVLAVLGGVAFAIEVPARQAFVVEMVGRQHLMNAIALNSALVNLARVVGPSLAGFLMALVGPAACFALDGLSYLVVILTLMSLRLPPFVAPKGTHSHLRHIVEGARVVWRTPVVRLVLTLLFTTGVFGWSFTTLLPAVAQGQLHLGESAYGFMMATFGVGAVGGALYVAGRKPHAGRQRGIFIGVGIMSAGLIAMSFTLQYWLICAAMVVSGFGAVMFVSRGNTLVQLSVDDSIRGRVMGIWALCFGGSLPLGSFLSGWLAESLHDPMLAIRVFAGLQLASLTAVWLFLPQTLPVAASGAIARDTGPPGSHILPR